MGKEIKRLILFSFAAITTFIAKAFFFFPFLKEVSLAKGFTVSLMNGNFMKL